MPSNSSAAPIASLVADTLARRFPLLRFPEPLEAGYQQAVAQQRRRSIAVELVFCVPLYVILLLVDHDLVPDSMGWALKLRLGVFLPLVALAGLALYKIQSPQLREWLAAALGMTACLFSTLISLSSHSPLAVYHLVILASIVIYAVLFGRFWPMLAMCLVAFTLHILAVWRLGALRSDIGVGTTLLMFADVTYMLYGCYLLEQSSRRAYLVDLQEADMDQALEQATAAIARVAEEDALTGLANRRHFTAFLSKAHESAQAEGHGLALMLIDVDHFKAYNDRYGHPAGDDCLREVARALTSAVRPGVDLVARWGGEEFAVVLPGADAARAIETAERLRESVHARGLVHEASSTNPVVTASLGVAVCQAATEVTISDLIAAADKALYEAKASGRNRVAMAHREAGAPQTQAATACHPADITFDGA